MRLVGSAHCRSSVTIRQRGRAAAARRRTAPCRANARRACLSRPTGAVPGGTARPGAASASALASGSARTAVRLRQQSGGLAEQRARQRPRRILVRGERLRGQHGHGGVPRRLRKQRGLAGTARPGDQHDPRAAPGRRVRDHPHSQSRAEPALPWRAGRRRTPRRSRCQGAAPSCAAARRQRREAALYLTVVARLAICSAPRTGNGGTDVKITITDLLIRACATALARTEINVLGRDRILRHGRQIGSGRIDGPSSVIRRDEDAQRSRRRR